MGRRGPPPKPTHLRLLEGNPGKRAINAAEPKPKPAIPTCPPELNGAARKEWKRMAKELAALGLLTKIDRAGLAAYCALYARWIEAEAQIVKHGMLIKSPNGYPMQSPYLSIATQCLKQLRGYLQEFGLSPSARSRVKAEKPDEEDPFEEFLKRGSGGA